MGKSSGPRSVEDVGEPLIEHRRQTRRTCGLRSQLVGSGGW